MEAKAITQHLKTKPLPLSRQFPSELIFLPGKMAKVMLEKWQRCLPCSKISYA